MSTGKHFTINKPSLLLVKMSYGSGRPVALGLKSSQSTTSSSELLIAIDPNEVNDTSGLSVSGLVAAGTYYVWCKTLSSGNTHITVNSVPLAHW